MKCFKLLKLYFYGFIYFLVALIFISLLLFGLSFTEINSSDLFLAFSVFSFLFMFYAGVYAASTIKTTYLKIKTNKNPIFLANILFALILTILITVLLFSFNYFNALSINTYTYIVFAVLLFGLYKLGNFIILFLKNTSYLRLLTLIIFIIAAIFYKETITNLKTIFNYLLNLENILQFNLRILLIASLLLIINYLKY